MIGTLKGLTNERPHPPGFMVMSWFPEKKLPEIWHFDFILVIKKPYSYQLLMKGIALQSEKAYAMNFYTRHQMSCIVLLKMQLLWRKNTFNIIPSFSSS